MPPPGAETSAQAYESGAPVLLLLLLLRGQVTWGSAGALPALSVPARLWNMECSRGTRPDLPTLPPSGLPPRFLPGL